MRTPKRVMQQDQACRTGVGHGHRGRPQGANTFTRRCAGRQTPSIGANGVDDLRLWASEPSGRAGTGDTHHHRVEYSQAPGCDAYRLDVARHSRSVVDPSQMGSSTLPPSVDCKDPGRLNGQTRRSSGITAYDLLFGASPRQLTRQSIVPLVTRVLKEMRNWCVLLHAQG